jgi:hypothetical protein
MPARKRLAQTSPMAPPGSFGVAVTLAPDATGALSRLRVLAYIYDATVERIR